MLRVVLDTNVIVSGILSSGGAARALLNLTRGGSIDLVTGPVLLDELEEVLGRFVSSSAAAEIRAAVEEIASVVEPTNVRPITSDPDDDHVLAAAITGRASFVAARDRHLLVLAEYEGIEILEPDPALHAIKRQLEGDL